MGYHHLRRVRRAAVLALVLGAISAVSVVDSRLARCEGANACLNSTAGEVAAPRSCNGASACMDSRTEIVGRGSCNGQDACYRAATELWRKDDQPVTIEDVRIGQNSCNGLGACYLLQGSVGNNSCNGGAFACFFKKQVGDCEFNREAVPACDQARATVPGS
ncbi:MAG: hypothetical protein R3E83_02560 [Burkholderiaceae bacterium]